MQGFGNKAFLPITVLLSVQLSDLNTVEANNSVWMSECGCSHIRVAGLALTASWAVVLPALGSLTCKRVFPMMHRAH